MTKKRQRDEMMVDEMADEVRAYITSLSEHRTSDVDEAVALTALESLCRMAKKDWGR
jgi:hypothetical protein